MRSPFPLLAGLMMLSPLEALAAPAPGPDGAMVVETVVEGSIVGALIMEGDAPVKALAEETHASPGGAPSSRSNRAASRGTTGNGSASPSRDRSGFAERSAREAEPTAASAEEIPSRPTGAIASGSWKRDLALALGAGVAGTLLFVAGGRRRGARDEGWGTRR